jgi:hypothetical protein
LVCVEPLAPVELII